MNSTAHRVLARLAEAPDVPHILLHGVDTRAVQTAARHFISSVFDCTMGIEAHHTVPDVHTAVRLTSTSHYTELHAADAGLQDRAVIKHVINTVASSLPLDKSRRPFRLLVLHDVDRLTLEAQQALRRTMEKFASGSRFVLLCTRIDQVLLPLRSRCVCLRLPVQQSPTPVFTPFLTVVHASTPAPLRLAKCRTLYQQAYEQGISVSQIIRDFVTAWSATNTDADASLQQSMLSCAAHYEHLAARSQSELYVLEAFFGRVLWLIDADADAQPPAKRRKSA